MQAPAGASTSPVCRASCAISEIARMLPDQAPSPSRPEQVTPLGIFFVEIKGIDDAVGSKAAKITAQFAPCRQYPHRFVIAQRDFPSFVNLRTRPRHVDAVGLLLPGRAGAAGRFKHEGP